MRQIIICSLIVFLLISPCISQTVSTPPTMVKNGLIAFTLRDKSGKLQIFTQKSDGTDVHQLTFEGDNGRSDWSPDGNQIVFGYSGKKGTGIAVMNTDGSNWRYLAKGTMDPDWSPDGKLIAFSRPSASADGRTLSQIWLMSPDGSNLRQLTTSGTDKHGPSWSFDGKQMVFILIGNPNSPSNPKPQIGIMNADGSNERILTTEPRMNVRIEPDGSSTLLETAYDANAPSWSPVDNRVVFWSGLETQYGQVWVINSDGTKSTQLTEDPTHRSSDDPSWSPDGLKILFNTGRSGKSELWVMDADGSNEKRVSDIDTTPCPGRGSWQPVIEGVTKPWVINRPVVTPADLWDKSRFGMAGMPNGMMVGQNDPSVILKVAPKGVFVLSGDTLTKLDAVSLKTKGILKLAPKSDKSGNRSDTPNPMRALPTDGVMVLTKDKVLVVVGGRFYSVDANTLRLIASITIPQPGRPAQMGDKDIDMQQQMRMTMMRGESNQIKLVVNGNTVYIVTTSQITAINISGGKVTGTRIQSNP